MSRDCRISSMADQDNRLYRFERSSGLPIGYFEEPCWRKAQRVALAAVVLVLLLVAAAAAAGAFA